MSYILTITDLHGHVSGLRNAIREGMSIAQKKGVKITEVVLLGDYMDNGPCVPELLDELVKMKNSNLPFKFCPIMGNHDLMNLYNMGLGEHFNVKTSGEARKDFNVEWLHYFNEYSSLRFTPMQYQSSIPTLSMIEEFLGTELKKSDVDYMDAVPNSHKKFLLNLPMYHRSGKFIFVHACLNGTDVEKQLEFLDKRDMSQVRFPHIPEQMKNKKLWNFTHPSDNIVVTGHCKLPNQKDFVSERRIAFHSGSCNGDLVHCALLDANANVVNDNTAIFFEVPTEETPGFDFTKKEEYKVPQERKSSNDAFPADPHGSKIDGL